MAAPSTSTQLFKIYVLSVETVLKLCRLCLEKKENMFDLFSVLTFEDGSTLDIENVFQSLTCEEKETMTDPRRPSNICAPCVDLLIAADSFQQKYKQSFQFLKEFLTNAYKDCTDKIPKQEINTDNETDTINHFDDVSSSNSIVEHTVSIATVSQRCNSKVEINRNIPNNSFPKNTYGAEWVKEEPTQEINAMKDITILSKDGMANEETASIFREENNEASKTSPRLHRCPICPKKFTALELKLHCRKHKVLKTYLKYAPKYKKKVKFFAEPRNKNIGLFSRDKIIHTCRFCNEEFEGEPFKEHVKLHRSEGNFRCNVCNRLFLGINHLKMHQLSHRKEAPFKCKLCKKSFFLRHNYKFHLLKHSDKNELPFKCEYCNKSFSNPEHLKRHKFNHENEVSYHAFYKKEKRYIKCNKCLQRFKTEEARSEHNCRLCCAKCHKLFESKSTLNSHVCKSVYNRTQCAPCGKVFQLPSSLKSHKFRCKTRTLCYVCGKNVRNITNHLQTHYPHKRGETLFQCAQCNKQFTYKQSLWRHLAEVHSDIVRYRCQYCSKGFKGKRNLEVHERIHIGVKKHVCNICGKGFLEKSYLRKHLRVHSQQEGLVLGLGEVNKIKKGNYQLS